ncbi:hypothetical protein QT972_00300 [Microcoleus sp. herbarium7]
MANTKLGAQKTAASKIGIPVEQYLQIMDTHKLNLYYVKNRRNNDRPD